MVPQGASWASGDSRHSCKQQHKGTNPMGLERMVAPLQALAGAHAEMPSASGPWLTGLEAVPPEQIGSKQSYRHHHPSSHQAVNTACPTLLQADKPT